MEIQSSKPAQLSTISSSQPAKPSTTSANKAEPTLLQGRAMVMELGAAVLGRGNIERWEKEGLELSYEAYEEAFNTLNQAMQWSQEQGQESLTSHSFNAHGIVAKAQDVPDWFIAEGEHSHAQHPHPGVQEAYQQGDLWFGHIRSARA